MTGVQTCALPILPHVKAGKLRALAVTGAHRSALLPDVPTANESALPGYITESWNGIMTTGGTPRSVIDTLSRAMLRVMATDNMKNRMMTLGADVTPLGPDEFAAQLKRLVEVAGRLVKRAGIKPGAALD